MWVGTKASGLLMVRREWDEWRQRSAGLSGRAISALAFDRANHLIASTDRGTYWTSLSGIRTSR
jgi:ligand-binding sensor domain-containing protein